MLAPLFEARYPQHPAFGEPLGMNEVSQLVNDFFSGAHPNLPESQFLAEIFRAAARLGVERGNLFVIESEENLSNLPLAQKVLLLVKKIPKRRFRSTRSTTNLNSRRSVWRARRST
jgi:hypothetical protein